jgi:uncharacterized membrane protein YphA (DoxX/SURF4 family)
LKFAGDRWARPCSEITHKVLIAAPVWPPFAALVAVVLTMVATSLLRASHPPAAATALLISLGGMQATASEAGTICAGVLILGVVGEGVRQMRLRVLPAAKR